MNKIPNQTLLEITCCHWKWMTLVAWLSKSMSVSPGLYGKMLVMKIEILPCFSNAMQTILAERSRLEFYLSSSHTDARHTVQTIFQAPLYKCTACWQMCVIADEFLQMPDLRVDILHLLLVLIKGEMHDGNFCRICLHGKKFLYSNFFSLWTSSNFGHGRWCRMSDECIWTYVFVISTPDSDSLSITELTQIISVISKTCDFLLDFEDLQFYFYFRFMLYL